MTQMHKTCDSQRLLQRTETDHVILVPLPHRAPEETPEGPCYIDKLPREILTQIIEIAVEASPYKTSRQLCLLCKRFEEIAKPHLYHTIDLGTIAPMPIRDRRKNHRRFFQRLQRTLRENPSLGRLCRELHFHIDWAPTYTLPRIAHFRDAIRLLLHFPATRTLHVHGGFEHRETWMILRNALRNMPSMQSMVLSREGAGGPPLVQMSDDLNLPDLHSLSLHGPSDGFFDPPKAGEREDPWPRSKSEFVPPHRKFTSSVKILSFMYPECTPEAMSEFLTFPEALEDLTIFGVHRTFVRLFESFTASVIANIMHSQCQFLRRINIGSFNGTVEGLDLQDFDMLECLRICSSNVPTTRVRSANVLLGRSLTSLTIECRWHEEEAGQVSWVMLTKDKVFGLRQLVQRAADSCDDTRPLALQTIDMLFDGYSSYYEWSARGKPETPWTRLKTLRDGLKEYGVRFTHNEQHLEDVGFEPKEARKEGDMEEQEMREQENGARVETEEYEEKVEDDTEEEWSDNEEKELNLRLAALSFDAAGYHKIDEYFGRQTTT